MLAKKLIQIAFPFLCIAIGSAAGITATEVKLAACSANVEDK